MTMQELYERWRAVIERADKHIGAYPLTLESLVQRAKETQKAGDYLEAIDMYLCILEENKACYYDLLVFLYKCVLCVGDFRFAYEVITLSEVLERRTTGNISMLRQPELRQELEAILERNECYADFYFRSPDVNSEAHKKEGERVLADFQKTIQPYAESSDYRFHCALGQELAQRILVGLRTILDWRMFLRDNATDTIQRGNDMNRTTAQNTTHNATAYALTVSETEAFFGTKPFVPQRIIRLVKEDGGNVQAPHAIRAELPYIGTIGYVGNTPETAYKGTSTAKDIYDLFEEEAYVRVMYSTESSAIVLFTTNARYHRIWKRKMHSDENASDPIICTL